MKEVADIGEAGLSNRMFNLEALWRAALPHGDVVYVGTPYYGLEPDNLTEPQNRIVREAALRDGRCYLDGMTPCVSPAYMTSHGYLYDVVHPSNACYQFLADLFWNELGFFALRIDRTLVCVRGPTGLTFQWPTATGITYSFESTTNWLNWSPVLSLAGDGFVQSYTDLSPSQRQQFYRLRLSKP
jgi:hypothetical protein